MWFPLACALFSLGISAGLFPVSRSVIFAAAVVVEAIRKRSWAHYRRLSVKFMPQLSVISSADSSGEVRISFNINKLEAEVEEMRGFL